MKKYKKLRPLRLYRNVHSVIAGCDLKAVFVKNETDNRQAVSVICTQ